MEAIFLKRWAELCSGDLSFEDERILPGTATIDGFPLDITIKDGILTLNCAGVWSGDYRKMAKGEWRGKGKFKSLLPHFKQVLLEFNLSNEVRLTPMSPVWERDYNLVEDEEGYKIIL